MTANGTSQQYGYEATLGVDLGDGEVAEVTVKAASFSTALRALHSLGRPDQLVAIAEQALDFEGSQADGQE